MNTAFKNRREQETPYLTALGAWALAFGSIIGWGAFILPGTTFLAVAGPVGTALGLGLGALVLLPLALNYHYLMNRIPEMGGTYAYSRSSFGYDYGFLTAWFLALSYVAILWANATALPLVVRALFGDVLRFGPHYAVAGYELYLGELLFSLLAVCLAAALCLRRRLAMVTQIVLSVTLLALVLFCAGTALTGGATASLQPHFSPERSPLHGTLAILALCPWAFVGFESISHSAQEACFSLKKSFGIMAAALAAGGVTYAVMSLFSATALPEGCATWVEYVADLSTRSDISAYSTFFAAQSALGRTGALMLGVAAVSAMLTCMLGCFVALSRLLRALAVDRLLPDWFAQTDANQAPRNAIVFLLIVSLLAPLLGRTVLGWVVDVTCVGASIAYAVTSAAAWKTAAREKEGRYVFSGALGLLFSLLFALCYLIPSLPVVQTLSTQAYLVLSLWCILGALVLRLMMGTDPEKRLGQSTFALVLLLALTIFTSGVWTDLSANQAVEQCMEPVVIQTQAQAENGSQDAADALVELKASRTQANRTLTRNILLQIGMIVIILTVVMDIFAFKQMRERRTEIEKALSEEAKRARSSFLSNMSHEIRTPMNAIIGLDNIALRRTDLPPETREQLEKIGGSAHHLMNLLNDILDMSLIETGKILLKDEEFSLREFLDKVNTRLNERCSAKGLQYECSPLGVLGDYYIGDGVKLQRALSNILHNAVKFTDAPGQVRLTVEDTEQGLRFTVRDTGVGIEESFLPHIFEPFAQEDITNTSRFGGSGLGLAISDHFVKLMGGSIQVESKKGHGSVFTITVPLQRSERKIVLEEGELPRLRACVVDDDPDARAHARLVLTGIGLDVEDFEDPWEAIDRLRQAQRMGTPFDVLITNFKLPNMNGLELTRTLRGFDNDKTAVIMLTGYNWDIVAEEALQGGVDSIGAKPLFPDSLQKEIRSILRRKQGLEDPTETVDVEHLPLAGYRILIAEDIAQNAEILRDLLELEDMVSEHAANGQIATEMFAQSAPGYYDAILMDVRMPVMDGLTATKTIRAMEHPDAQSIPIIAMTANVFDEDVRLSLEAGMDAHLTKPVELDLLYATLRRFFAQKAAQKS